MAAMRTASRWNIARLFGNRAAARGKKDFGEGFLSLFGSRTFMVAPGSPVWMDRDYSRFALEAYIRNVVAHRCISMVAQGAACVPVKLFFIDLRGIRKELMQHPLLDLLHQPNPAQAHASFMEAIYQYRQIAGNAFIQAIGPAGTAPQELHVLRPDRVAIIAGKNGQPAAYRYTVNGIAQDYPIDPVTWLSQVLHLKTFHPLNDWYGLSPVEAVAYSIDQHNQAGAWNQALLQNGARPSGALVVRGADGKGGSLSEDQYYRLKAQIDEQFAGPVNAGRPMLLEGGLDWKELSLSPKDMDFIQSKNASARDIALGFGVPPQMLGIPGDNTYSNLQEARLAMWEQTIVPIVRATLHSMSQWFGALYGSNIQLHPDFSSVEALAGRNQVVWDRVEKASFLSDNEKRAAVGYPPLPPAPAAAQFQTAARDKRPKARGDFSGNAVDDGDGGGSDWNDDLDTGFGNDSGGGTAADEIGQTDYETTDSNNTDNANDQQDSTYTGEPDEPIEPVYPVETILTGLTAGEALSAARGLAGIGEDATALTEDKIANAAQSIEDYLDGPAKFISNDNGDAVMMNDGQKIRFDINDPHGYDPHFHIEELDSDGKWKDAGNQHIYPFNKE